MGLFERFKLAKELDVSDGEIKIMKTPVCFALTHILANLQKDLIETIGFEKTYFQLYETNKNGSYTYNKSFIKKHNFKDHRKILNWQVNIITLGGWGDFEVVYLDLKENKLKLRFSDSPLPKLYGKAKYPVCIFATGFIAGGAAANFGTKVEGIETKCVSMGDPYCEMTFGSPKLIKKMREAQWKKLGIGKVIK
jgi:predicted hydrocarbon binding protein